MSEKVYTFEIEYIGRNYRCERRVAGDRTFRQTVTVVGVGSMEDSAEYGPKRHRVESMAGIAKLLAFEILQGRRK